MRAPARSPARAGRGHLGLALVLPVLVSCASPDVRAPDVDPRLARLDALERGASAGTAQTAAQCRKASEQHLAAGATAAACQAALEGLAQECTLADPAYYRVPGTGNLDMLLQITRTHGEQVLTGLHQEAAVTLLLAGVSAAEAGEHPEAAASFKAHLRIGGHHLRAVEWLAANDPGFVDTPAYASLPGPLRHEAARAWIRTGTEERFQALRGPGRAGEGAGRLCLRLAVARTEGAAQDTVLDLAEALLVADPADTQALRVLVDALLASGQTHRALLALYNRPGVPVDLEVQAWAAVGRLQAQVEDLAGALAGHPADLQAHRRLVAVLEAATPPPSSTQGTGDPPVPEAAGAWLPALEASLLAAPPPDADLRARTLWLVHLGRASRGEVEALDSLRDRVGPPLPDPGAWAARLQALWSGLAPEDQVQVRSRLQALAQAGRAGTVALTWLVEQAELDRPDKAAAALALWDRGPGNPEVLSWVLEDAVGRGDTGRVSSLGEVAWARAGQDQQLRVAEQVVAALAALGRTDTALDWARRVRERPSAFAESDYARLVEQHGLQAAKPATGSPDSP